MYSKFLLSLFKNVYFLSALEKRSPQPLAMKAPIKKQTPKQNTLERHNSITSENYSNTVKTLGRTDNDDSSSNDVNTVAHNQEMMNDGLSAERVDYKKMNQQGKVLFTSFFYFLFV